jgi:hypothetical protein
VKRAKKAEPKKAEAIPLALPATGTAVHFTPPAPVATGAADLGQRLWEWGQRAHEAGDEAFTQMNRWAGNVIGANSLESQQPETKIGESSEIESSGTRGEAHKTAIGALMEKEVLRLRQKSRIERRPEDDILDALRPQIKRNPNLLLSSLEDLNRKTPFQLNAAVRLLSSAYKVDFFDPPDEQDGKEQRSHHLAGSRLEALGLGSKDLQTTIQQLGSVVAVYQDEDATEPSFKYHLGQHFSPSEVALTSRQLEGLSVPPNGDTLEFFSTHAALMEDLIRGLSDGAWTKAEPYFHRAIEAPQLQKKLKGQPEKASKVLNALMARSGLSKDQRWILILRELMGQPADQVASRFGVSIGTVGRKNASAIGHLNDSTKADLHVVPSMMAKDVESQTEIANDFRAQIELRKRETNDYVQKQEKRTLDSMVVENVIPSVMSGRSALNQGKKSIGSYWIPTRKTHNYRAPLNAASTFEILSAASDGQLRRSRITPLLYKAIIRSVPRPGEEWTYEDISKLYKILRGMGPVIRVPQVEEMKSLDADGNEQVKLVTKNHLVRTSDAFHVLFPLWGENRQMNADIELFEAPDAEGAALKAFAEAIRKGRELLSEDAKEKLSVPSGQRKRRVMR